MAASTPAAVASFQVALFGKYIKAGFYIVFRQGRILCFYLLQPFRTKALSRVFESKVLALLLRQHSLATVAVSNIVLLAFKLRFAYRTKIQITFHDYLDTMNLEVTLFPFMVV